MDVILAGPVGDRRAGGHGQGQVGLVVLVVPLGHRGAIAAPFAVLDPVPRSAGKLARSFWDVLTYYIILVKSMGRSA